MITYVADLYERHHKPDGALEHRLRVHATGRPVAELVFAGNAAEPERRYLHADGLGSTTLVTGAGAGPGVAPPVLERRAYDPFGAPRSPDGASDAPPGAPRLSTVGFAGHEDDAELGLVNLRGRAYEPRLARVFTAESAVGANRQSVEPSRRGYFGAAGASVPR